MGISPVVDLNGADGGTGATLSYTENDAAAAIAPAATVTDADSPDLDSGTLTVSFGAGGSADDRLTILHTGNGAGEIGVSGNAVSFAGTQIGTFTGGISGGTPLLITLDADATPAAVEALTRAIAYSNLSNAPATAARTVDFVLTDGDGDTSVVASATVNVAAVNDAPLFSSPASAISRVNTTDAGVEATGQDSAYAAISPDGTKVLFYSNAADLVAGDTNARVDLFLKDLTTGAITRVSTTSSGAEATGGTNAFSLANFTPAFSPDGTRIAFSSILETLVDGDTNLREDVFVKDLTTGSIVRANTTSAGAQGTAAANGSGEVVFSPDGTKVMFISQEAGLVAGDTNAAYDVFIKDLTNGAITRVSTDGAGAQIGGLSQAPVFSPDGTKILFSTAVNAVVPGDTNSVGDIFLKDLGTGAVALISSGAFGGLSNGSTVFGAFSPDGTKVAFASAATNLVGGDTNSANDIFLKDIATGAITRVSTDSAGGQANGASGAVSFSPEGTRILFSSAASNLVSGDTNGVADYFMKDLVTGAVTRVSTDASGAQANASAGSASFSRDGTKIVFNSGATNLVPGDTNGRVDVFVATLGSIGPASYTENGAAVQIAPVVNVGDDGTTYAGGTLTVAITAGGVTGDALSLATPTGLGLTVTGASVRVAGIVVGTLSASATSLTFGLNGNATDAAVRVIAEAVRFASSSDNPGASRTVTFTLVDGGGGSDTSSFTRTIAVTPTNDAPAEVSAALTVTKGALVGITPAQLEFDDPDQVAADTAVTYTVTIVTSHGLLLFDGTPLGVGDSFTQDDVNSGRLSYDHDGSGAASDSFQFSVADGDGQVSTGRSFAITVSDPPTAVISGPLLAHEGDRLELQIDAEWFTVHPRVVAFDDGSFIVIGEVPELANSFASDIFGWRYDADGVAQGSAFRINQHTWLYQTVPDAAVLADGSFIVSWLSTNQGSPGNSVSARHYAADGTALGDEFRVNSAALLDLSAAIVVTELENGGFVIVWADYGIKGRIFDAAGQALGGEFDIAAGAFPAVASLAGGGFAVAWQANPDLGIYVRQFDVSGTAVTAETRLGTEANGYQDPVSVAGLADGSYVVAWLKYHAPTDATAVFAQHFAANGTAMGGEFMAHNASVYEHREPVALALADGGYFIGWSGSDSNGGGVFGQRYTPGDVKVGGEGRIDNLESGAETDPALAALSDGGMIAAWAYQLGNLHHAQVQRYDATFPAVVEQATLSLKGGSLAVGDVDAAGTVTATLAVGYGVLHVVAGTSGALVSGSDSGSVTITGTVAQINALFRTDATSVVTYSPNTDAPPATAELTLTVEYGGGSDVASQTITITAVNDAPAIVAQGTTVSGIEDANLVFAAANANAITVADVDSGSLTVTLTVLSGTLTLTQTTGLAFGTGDGLADATMTFVGSAADINAALDGLVYRGNLNYEGGDTLTVLVGDGIATDSEAIAITLADDGKTDGTSGVDAITGTPDPDHFDLSQGGDDTVSGLGGNDEFYFGAAFTADDTVDGGDGDNDRIVLEGDYSGANALALGASTIAEIEAIAVLAGFDYDITTVDANVPDGGQLIISAGDLGSGDSLTFNGSAESTGSFDILGGQGIDLITTGGGYDRIIAGSGSDVITSGGGRDVLDGGLGADQMYGGADHDIYKVDNAGDRVNENANEGLDLVEASITFQLGANVEKLTLTGSGNISGAGNALVNVLFGNAGNNWLAGLQGNDLIDGGLGGDRMDGGADDDTYTVDNTLDRVNENVNEGTDQVLASITFQLGGNLENLTLTGSADTSGAGNALANVLTGNAGNNWLAGLAGNDLIDGGLGSDRMQGGADDDTYTVDNTLDRVIEFANEGIDQVIASITFELGANVENLTLTGNGNTAGGGNALANVLTGNSGNNWLVGVAGNDVLDGGLGADRLDGGADQDTFAFTSALGGGNVDVISGFVAADDTIQLENAVFTGLTAGVLAAGAFNTGASATQADDRIIYDANTGALWFDADGLGGAAAVQFATLVAGLALTSADFVVI